MLLKKLSLLSLLILTLLFSGQLAAQAQKEILSKGQEYLNTGDYELAQKYLEKAANNYASPQNLEALVNLYSLTGNYKKALENALYLSKTEQATLGFTMAGEIAMHLGEYKNAQDYFMAARIYDPNNIRANVNLGLLLRTLGIKDKYIRLFSDVFDNYDPELVYSAQDLTYIAIACRYYAMESDEVDRSDTLSTLVQEILPEAISLNKYNFRAHIEMADIFLQAYDDVEAKVIIHEALKLNAKHPGLLLMKAKIQAQQYASRPKAIPTVEYIAEINSQLPGAWAIAAELYLADEEYGKALIHIKKALEINPLHLETLSLQAAYHYLLREDDKYEKLCQKILKINPIYGELYHIVSATISYKRQFQDGVALCRKAIELDPFLWNAYIELGTNLMRVGNQKEAEEQFLIVQEKYNFHTQTHNMLMLLDKYKNFEEFRTKHFIIRLHKSEAELMSPLLTNFLEEAYDVLTKQYKFEPKTPITFEMFRDHQDFSVRTVGLSAIPANGACFGQVVTAHSAQDLPIGSFNWASVAWHEFAHVITLQLSDYQVPRWFTEGLSEYSERQRNPGTVRKLDQELYSAHTAGLMRGIVDLNAGFTRPRYMREVEICYYQGGLICLFLDKTYGFDKIIQMLKLYGQGKETEEILQIVFSLSPEKFDKLFMAWLQKNIFDKMNVMPSVSPEKIEEFKDLTEEDPDDIEAYINLAIGYLKQFRLEDAEINAGYILALDPENIRAYEILGQIDYHRKKYDRARRSFEEAIRLGSKDFHTRLMLGLICLGKKETEKAAQYLREAKEIFPNYVGGNNPYLILAKIYEAQKKTDLARKEREAFLALDANNYKLRIKLANEYAKEKNYEKVAQLLKEAQDIFPFDFKMQALRAKALEKIRRKKEAIQAYHAVVALKPKKDIHVYYTKLAQLYLETSNEQQAKFYAAQALQIKPGYRPANKIFQKIK